MNNSNIIKEIEKAMNFVTTKIYEGNLLIDVLDEKKHFFSEIKNGNFNFYESEEMNEKSFKGVLLLSENKNDIEDFKIEFKKIIWKLDNNGFIIIKYANDDSADVELIKDEFESFLKEEGLLDIASYITLQKNEKSDVDKQGLVILARFHEELLKESPEYEEYSKNFIATSKCGGCSKKGGGCGSCSGCCKK